jgi:hypothetical protein
MAFTGHGHYIVGSKKTGNPPKHKTRCYADRRCPHCASDIKKYWEKNGADPVEEKKMDVIHLPEYDDGAFLAKAKELVWGYIIDGLDENSITPEFKIFTVWFSKTLQNWKAILGTTLPDNLLYEVTYNGDKMETYIDVYDKIDNVCIRDGD